MVRIFLSGFLIILSHYIFAQTHDLSKANTGFLFTKNDSLSGKITVDMESNTIWLKSGNSLINFSAKQINKVIYFDENGDLKTLISGIWGTDSKSLLFEALVDGKVPLLYREGLKFSQYDEEVYAPYYVRKGESIFALGNKKAILKLLDNEKSIVDFVKHNKLKLKNREEIVLLFGHANGVNPKSFGTIAVDED